MEQTAIYLAQIPTRSIPFAFMQMAFARRSARSIPGVSFAKLMGTGSGTTFTPSDSNLRQWAILIVATDHDVVENARLIRGWKKRSTKLERFLLNPVSSHGKWSKREPFIISPEPRTNGPVVAITRARLKWSQAIRFWKSIPPVVEDLHMQPGLIMALGIGEAPIGLQGTLSVWKSEGDLRDFAYKNAPHRVAIENTKRFDWYSEELFARFDLVNTADFPHVH
jgi:hypothetical protein